MAKKDKKAEKAAKPSDPAAMNRRQQMVETYRMTKRVDPVIGWLLLGSFLLAGLVGGYLIYLIPPQGTFGLVMAVISGILLGLLAAMIIFGRRAQKAAYRQMEGQLGAGARALTMLRRGWKIEEMVGFNKQQDMVHRVVGPPGIVLVGEGNPQRLKQLLAGERRKHERVLDGVPVHEVMVGDGDGQVPLPRLVKHVRKLGRNVKPAEITDILHRLKALDSQRPKVPMPHGPMPTSMKGMRQNLRGR
ncbi:DUF4191 domain-containing protein [Nocardioides panacisoli]|uniref:DUF4191 domain-containing protein n=1 Tax=Nocardioides panacisoli TaxID=627624 RepID=UPI001C634B17|nr:DUF4191 domain-containing protein [Nocardioides panacisoli]QYJ05332.1 DUF4191 domain-containing protein [Nocardioides panacisoli]